MINCSFLTIVLYNSNTQLKTHYQTQPKRDSAFEQKHVLFQVERSEEVLKTDFLVKTKETSPAELKKSFFGRYSTSFWKVSILLKKQKLFL